MNEQEIEILKNNPPYELDKLDKDTILSKDIFEYIFIFSDTIDREKIIVKLQEKASELKVLTNFKKILKEYEKDYNKSIPAKEGKIVGQENLTLKFPDDENNYKGGNYMVNPNGGVYQVTEKGINLISYKPVIPVETYTDIDGKTSRVKLGIYDNNEWRYEIVNRKCLSSANSITKLATKGIPIAPKNANNLCNFLADFEFENSDIIPNRIIASRMGWEKGELIPYSDKYIYMNEDGEEEIKKFKEKGTLEEWVEFFKERRRYNTVSQISMAAGISSLLLKKLNQTGFVFHIFGKSEWGKTVSSMAAQSIFGNPDVSGDKGIGINFNSTDFGVELTMNTYRNIPVFINEMEFKKGTRSFDKLLYLVAEGKGRTKSTKDGELVEKTNWKLVTITNGETDILKDGSNEGAINRCVSMELKGYTYENLREVAEFSKQHYGTAIREFLKHLNEYNTIEIFENQLKSIDFIDTTSKRKILYAILLTADKIFTDIIFKDAQYLTIDDFKESFICKQELDKDERALEIIKGWFVSEMKHFLGCGSNDLVEKNTVYGKKKENGYVAFIPSILKKKLEEEGFDFKEATSAWKDKKILLTDTGGKKTRKERILESTIRCVNLKLNIEEAEASDKDFADAMSDEEFDKKYDEIEKSELPW